MQRNFLSFNGIRKFIALFTTSTTDSCFQSNKYIYFLLLSSRSILIISRHISLDVLRKVFKVFQPKASKHFIFSAFVLYKKNYVKELFMQIPKDFNNTLSVVQVSSEGQHLPHLSLVVSVAFPGRFLFLPPFSNTRSISLRSLLLYKNVV